jgi:hypothetical protein
VNIWIGGCCAPHASTARELTANVPSRAFPDPVNLRSRRPPTCGGVAVVGSVADVPVELAWLCAACEAEVAPEVPDELPAVLLVKASLCVLAWLELPVELPPPQPARAVTTSSATKGPRRLPREGRLRDELNGNLPSGELIGSTG